MDDLIHAAANELLRCLHAEYPEKLPLYCRSAAEHLDDALTAADAREVPSPVWLNTESTSYWQRGCNDGRANRPHQWPEMRSKPSSPANESYDNGYAFGRRQRSLEGRVSATREEISRG